MTDRAAIIEELRRKEPQRWCWDRDAPDQRRLYTDDEYEASIEESAVFEEERIAQEAVETEHRTERDLIRAALGRLDAGTLPAAQVQKAVAWLIRDRMRELPSQPDTDRTPSTGIPRNG